MSECYVLILGMGGCDLTKQFILSEYSRNIERDFSPYLVTWRPSNHPSQRFNGAWLEHANHLKSVTLYMSCFWVC